MKEKVLAGFLVAFLLLPNLSLGVSVKVKEVNKWDVFNFRLFKLFKVTAKWEEFEQGNTASGTFAYDLNEFKYDGDYSCGTTGRAVCTVYNPSGEKVDSDSADVTDCTSVQVWWSHDLSEDAPTGEWETVCNIYSDGITEIVGQSAYWDVVEPSGCESQYTKVCSDGDVYWKDSCGNLGAKFKDCGPSTCGDPVKYCSGDTLKSKRTCYDRWCSAGKCYQDSTKGGRTIKECKYGCENGACVGAAGIPWTPIAVVAIIISAVIGGIIYKRR